MKRVEVPRGEGDQPVTYMVQWRVLRSIRNASPRDIRRFETLRGEFKFQVGIRQIPSVYADV